MRNLLFLLFLFSLSCLHMRKPENIAVVWHKNVIGDFSFKDTWNYPEGVYLNQHGQLSCDGF